MNIDDSPNAIQPGMDDKFNLPTDLIGFSSWLFELIEPYAVGRILEIGSGSGLISDFFIKKAIPIYLSDELKRNRDILRAKYPDPIIKRDVYNMDLVNREFESNYQEAFGRFKSVVALNVLENGYYEKLALRNAIRFLRSHGRLIFIAPAHTTMSYGLENDLDSWKRFNRQSLKDLLGRDFQIIMTRYFNLEITTGNMPPYPNLGLSVLAVARRIA